jgi:hypothetical protein
MSTPCKFADPSKSINPLPQKINKSMSITRQFSVNLPIHYQSVNHTPIGQSNVKFDEYYHTSQSTPDPMPKRPYKDYQTCAPISGESKK